MNKPSYTIPARYWKDGYDALVKYNDNEINDYDDSYYRANIINSLL